MVKPLTDDQVWGSDAVANPVDTEPACPLRQSRGGCPDDCTQCDDWVERHLEKIACG